MEAVDALEQAHGRSLYRVRGAAAGMRLGEPAEQDVQPAELAVQPHGRAADRADALRPVMQAVEQDVILDAVGFFDEAHDGVGDVVDDVFDDLLEQACRAGGRLAAIERFGGHADRVQRFASAGQQEVVADDPA